MEMTMSEMTLNEYKAWVVSAWTSKTKKEYTLRDDFIMTVGLGGETGEVLEVLKKAERDGKLDKDDLTLELGDVLYYLMMICDRHDIDPAEVMKQNIKKVNGRNAKKKKTK